MKVWNILKEYLLDFVDMVYPRICLGCDTILLHQEEHICMPCKFSLPKTNYHQRPENSLAQKFVFEPRVKAVASYLYYNKGGIAQKLVGELKYRGVEEIGHKIGLWYGKDLKKAGWSVDYIVPVPLYESKLARRGFNQSEVFANGLSEPLEVPVVSDVVVRVRNTDTQTKKNRVQRWKNVGEVYLVLNELKVEGKRILVVDDVLTTGATLGELITVLVEAGAKEVYVATIAAGQ